MWAMAKAGMWQYAVDGAIERATYLFPRFFPPMKQQQRADVSFALCVAALVLPVFVDSLVRRKQGFDLDLKSEVEAVAVYIGCMLNYQCVELGMGINQNNAPFVVLMTCFAYFELTQVQEDVFLHRFALVVATFTYFNFPLKIIDAWQPSLQCSKWTKMAQMVLLVLVGSMEILNNVNSNPVFRAHHIWVFMAALPFVFPISDKEPVNFRVMAAMHPQIAKPPVPDLVDIFDIYQEEMQIEKQKVQEAKALMPIEKQEDIHEQVIQEAVKQEETLLAF